MFKMHSGEQIREIITKRKQATTAVAYIGGVAATRPRRLTVAHKGKPLGQAVAS